MFQKSLKKNCRKEQNPQFRLTKELIKENYDLGFITFSEDCAEKDLEDEIEHHITRFLLELGKGWAFAGRQEEIVVAGKTRKIDLLFYHIRYQFYLIVELKAKPFEPEAAGKLNFYVNAADELLRTRNENTTAGLLICKERTGQKYSGPYRVLQLMGM